MPLKKQKVRQTGWVRRRIIETIPDKMYAIKPKKDVAIASNTTRTSLSRKLGLHFPKHLRDLALKK